MRMVIQIFHPKVLLARLQLLSYLGIFRCPKPSPKARQCISDAYFNQRILHGIVKLHHAPRLTPKNNQPHTVGFRKFRNRQVSPRIWCNRPVPSQNRAKPCRIHWVQLRENYLLEDIWIAGNHQATEKWHPTSTFLMGRVVLGPRKIYQNCCKRTCDLILAHGGSLAQPYAGVWNLWEPEYHPELLYGAYILGCYLSMIIKPAADSSGPSCEAKRRQLHPI